MPSEAASPSLARRRAAAFLAFMGRVAQRLFAIGLARTASSLAFTTLLGVVPLATVAFTLLSRIPMFEGWLASLERFLLRLSDRSEGSAECGVGVWGVEGE